ncbi:hypothetical protein MKK69_22120 [Methylobacterium sp. J-026]|uniref:hypothetical protein n=1 Tax=Methylobacterium sp. J-026 TaxID=2836624 RepID=UPI001FB91A08|nr:hypothetical protein [Methylobacterium sp. J-026]MCJ2136711.1 hypothetical protein [Methylobacterium sp. J-026]
MIGTIVPLRLKRDETSALADLDTAAATLLAEGRSTTLSAARFDAILDGMAGRLDADLVRALRPGAVISDAVSCEQRLASAGHV